jgi:hypothetical protein
MGVVFSRSLAEPHIATQSPSQSPRAHFARAGHNENGPRVLPEEHALWFEAALRSWPLTGGEKLCIMQIISISIKTR